jgi:choline monooxygenase
MIHKDIRKAHTLSSEFYLSEKIYQKVLQQGFLPSWQLLDPKINNKEEENCRPFNLLENSLDEPLLFIQHEAHEYCLSNVCTHRAMIILDKACSLKTIRCPYHGRCFQLDGKFKSMPEFEDTANFPGEADHLRKYAIHKWGPLKFISLHPAISFENTFSFIADRVDWFPFEELKYADILSRDYEINAHWALYCDNYLEGFHVPFVHEQLNKVLEYGEYQIEVFDYGVLQLGISKDKSKGLNIPTLHPDFGKSIYAYYFFLFPNIMINIYNWGISVNLIEPNGKSKTRVRFFIYLLEGKTAVDFEDTAIHETEMEDEYVVEAVQRGIQSFSFNRGRFSPKQEKGVHHFHRWLEKTSS